MVYKVYIGNLPGGTSEAEIEREFARFGTLATVWVARKPAGFAFVEFTDSRDADDAVRELDGFQHWRVEHSRAGAPKPRQPSYGGGGGYNDRGPSRYGRDRSPPPRRRRSPSYDRSRRRSPSPYARRSRRSPSPPSRRRSPSPRRSLSPAGATSISPRRGRSPAGSRSP